MLIKSFLSFERSSSFDHLKDRSVHVLNDRLPLEDIIVDRPLSFLNAGIFDLFSRPVFVQDNRPLSLEKFSTQNTDWVLSLGPFSLP